MKNKLMDRRVMIAAAVLLVAVLILALGGCVKDTAPDGTVSSAPAAVTESPAGGDSGKAENAGADTAQGKDAEKGSAAGTGTGSASGTGAGTGTAAGTEGGSGTGNSAADGGSQSGQGVSGQDTGDAPEEAAILENGGELEIIIPEGQETFGE